MCEIICYIIGFLVIFSGYVLYRLEFPAVDVLWQNSKFTDGASRVVKFRGIIGLLRNGIYLQSGDHWGWMTDYKIKSKSDFEKIINSRETPLQSTWDL